MKGDAAMSQRSMPTDPSTLYGSGMMQPKSGLVSTGELIAINNYSLCFSMRKTDGNLGLYGIGA